MIIFSYLREYKPSILKIEIMSDIKIYSGTSQVKMMEIKNMLENEGIEYFEMNKLDSSYTGILGELQLYVSEADFEKAEELLKNIENE